MSATAGTARPPAGRPGRGSARLWLLAVAVGLLPAVALSTLVLPAAAGLAGRWPWIALIAFRGLLAVLIAVPALVLAGLAVLLRRHRVARTVVGALAAVGLLAVLGELVVLGVRGYLPVHPAGGAPADGLTVVVTNTDVSAADPAGLAALDLAVGADVVSMPETDPHLAAEVAARLAAAGRVYQVFGVAEQGRIKASSLLVSVRLGRYRQVNQDGDGIGEVLAEPVGGVPGRPTLVAVHPQAPVSATLAEVAVLGVRAALATCSGTPDTVLAGDFNATVDRPAFRGLVGCVDVAQSVGAAGVATWPQGWPRFLGAPLDHVLTTDGRWRPVAAWTEPIRGSDHRALVTRLLPAAGRRPAVSSWAGG